MEDVNNVLLTGVLERDPVTRFADHGTQSVGFTLRLTEAGPAGQAFTVFIPCLAYGHAAEIAQALQPGETVLLQGRLKWRRYRTAKGEDKSGLAVNARLIRTLRPAGAMAEVAPAPTLTNVDYC